MQCTVCFEQAKKLFNGMCSGCKQFVAGTGEGPDTVAVDVLDNGDEEFSPDPHYEDFDAEVD